MKYWNVFFQFIKFGIVGISNTAISYVTYSLFVFFGVHYIIASIIAFIISVTNAFFWNNKYVFKKNNNEQRKILHSFLKTILAYSFTGLLLNNILLFILIEFVIVNKYIAPLIILLITIPVNFLLNKFWAFKVEKEEINEKN